MLESGDRSDFVVEVGGRSFAVHTFVLRLSSGYFRDLFESSDAETKGKCSLEHDPCQFGINLSGKKFRD